MKEKRLEERVMVPFCAVVSPLCCQGRRKEQTKRNKKPFQKKKTEQENDCKMTAKILYGFLMLFYTVRYGFWVYHK